MHTAFVGFEVEVEVDVDAVVVIVVEAVAVADADDVPADVADDEDALAVVEAGSNETACGRAHYTLEVAAEVELAVETGVWETVPSLLSRQHLHHRTNNLRIPTSALATASFPPQWVYVDEHYEAYYGHC